MSGRGVWLALPSPPGPATGAQGVHARSNSRRSTQLFMEQVKIGDALFHGDAATEEKLKVKLSNTGMGLRDVPPVRRGHASGRSTRSGRSR